MPAASIPLPSPIPSLPPFIAELEKDLQTEVEFGKDQNAFEQAAIMGDNTGKRGRIGCWVQ